MLVLQGSGLQFIIMVFFKGNGEPGTHAIIAALDQGEGKLSFDDALLDAAQHFGLEIDLYHQSERCGWHSGDFFKLKTLYNIFIFIFF